MLPTGFDSGPTLQPIETEPRNRRGRLPQHNRESGESLLDRLTHSFRHAADLHLRDVMRQAVSSGMSEDAIEPLHSLAIQVRRGGVSGVLAAVEARLCPPVPAR